MGFSAPSLLFGILGALVPLILHLLFRKKPKVAHLPTLRFVRKANQRVLRRHRLRRKLLLLVRMLLLGLTAVAMSRPFIQNSTQGLSNQLKGDIVVIIDNSYFTQATTDEGQVLDIARRLASPLVEHASNRVSIVLTCPLQGLEPLPLSADKRSAYSFLEEMEPSSRLGNLSDAVSQANELLSDTNDRTQNRTIIVLSSQRRLTNLSIDGTDAAAVNIVPMDILDGLSIENAAIVKLEARQAPELGAEVWQVNAEVAYFGSKSRTSELMLTIPPDLELAVPITLTPGARTFKTFQFAKTFDRAVKGSVSLTQDRLPYDDTAHFWLTSNQTIKVLAINGGFSPQPQDDELFYLERALADGTTNGDEFDVEGVAVESWDAKRWRSPNVLILANVGELPDTLTHKIESFVMNGGGVLITLGDQIKTDVLNRQLARLLPRPMRGLRRAGDAAASDQGKDRKPSRLDVFDESSPIFRDIPSPTDTSISKALVTNYGLFSNDTSVAVDELISLDEGAPILISAAKGRGQVMVLSTTLDRQWTDLPIQPDFVPFITGVVRHLSGVKPQPTQILNNGTPLKLVYPPGEGLTFELDLPSGTQRRINLPNNEIRWRTITNLEESGHYTLTDTNSQSPRVIRFTVLPNHEASDFTAQEGQSNEKTDRQNLASSATQPTNVWPFILLVLFILLGTESRLAYWFSPAKGSPAPTNRRSVNAENP